MVRPRWPDVVLVVGIVALVAGGVWIFWGEDLRGWLWPHHEQVESAPSGPGVT